MNLGIAGRIALVTGADSGMGLETARMFLEEDVRVIITDKDRGRLENSRDHLKPLGDVSAIAADVTKLADVKSLFAVTSETIGAPDIVVHCAGVTGATGDFLDIDDAGWQQTLDINLMGAVRICREAIPAMRRKKWGPDRADIV